MDTLTTRPNNGPEEFLSTDQVVDRLDGQLSRSTLNKWRCDGKGPPYCKLGSRVVYPVSGLMAFLEARTRPCGLITKPQITRARGGRRRRAAS